MLKTMKSFFLFPFISFVYGMDYGQAGVYDSPMATDYYVKRFGFLFGGGRSGNSGLQAMQKAADLGYKNSLPTTVYNPSGLYGLKAMRNSVYDFPQPSVPSAKPLTRLSFLRVKEKKMVELSPIKLELNRNPKTFSRFMAVP